MSSFNGLQNGLYENGRVERNSESNEGQDDSVVIATGNAATVSAQISTKQAIQKFSKPESYTGNRYLFDDGAAKRKAKLEAFSGGKKVFDPYTGEELVLTVKEAKALYGENWQKHLAESDHVIPLERVFEKTKDNPWLTDEDIKNIGNSHIEVISRKSNNAKRSRTNEEFVKAKQYREDKDVYMPEEGEQRALQAGEKAKIENRQSVVKKTTKNMLRTGHEAGMAGAKSSGETALTMSGIMNLVAVCKGEKDPEEAIADTLVAGGKGAATGYVMSNGLTVISNSLTGSSSKFIQALAKSNVPGKIVTAVMILGDTFKRYGNGEISTQQFVLDLGEKGLNFATAGYSMMVGQMLIPIPIVGSAIGALVGTALTSGLYHSLINTLQTKELEHQERLRIIAECREVAEKARAFRVELESYLEDYFKEYRDCFDEALSEMHFAFQIGDSDGVIAGANQITRKLGGQVHYETVDQFRNFLNDNSVDVL